MLSQKILLVEDEKVVADIVRDYLEDANYSVEVFNSGVGVVEQVRNSNVNLVLLDLNLPGVDGITTPDQPEYSQADSY